MAHNQDVWRHVVPPLTQTDDPENTTIPVHVPHGSSVVVVVADASGYEEFLTQVEDNTPPQDVDGVLTGRARFSLGHLEEGEYEVRASLEDGSEAAGRVLVGALASGEGEPDVETPLSEEPLGDVEALDVSDELPIKAPAAIEPEPVPEPEPDLVAPVSPLEGIGREEYGNRNWGIATPLYAMRSSSSWGIGDLADLADLATICAGAHADYLLLSPFVTSAADAITALGLTPTPGTGEGVVIDPVYLRPEDVREVAYLPTSQRTMLEWGSETIRQTNTDAGEIDVEQVWEAKRGALEVIYAAPRSARRQAEFSRFAVAHGRELADYIHAAVGAETPDPAQTFATLCADSSAGAAARREHAERIEFFLWLQWLAHDQLAAAAHAADNGGMRIGLVFTAPATASEAFLTSLLRHGGGIYLSGAPALLDAADGSAEALTRAAGLAAEVGAVTFADGTDAPTRDALRERGILPHTTLWAEFDGEEPPATADFPEEAMVAVTTLADPPTAGFLTGEHLDVLHHLGLLTSGYEEARKDHRIRKERVLENLREAFLIADGATERQTVEALYRYLVRTPARLITVTLGDAVGNRRQLVAGGTYPDWRYPWTDGAGSAVLLDDLATSARFTSLLEALDADLREV